MNVGISYFDAYNFMANSYRRTTLASRALWYYSFPLTGEAQVTDPFLGKKKDFMISKNAILPRMGSQRAIPRADITKISPQRKFTHVDRVRYLEYLLEGLSFVNPSWEGQPFWIS